MLRLLLPLCLALTACKSSTPAHVRLITAPQGDVVAALTAQAAASRKDGRTLVVYVGASWCEPCQYFHHAAESGSLDHDFPDLDLLVFDLDADRDRLAAADCASRFIPLLSTVTDGRCSPGARMEGSVKGDGAVAEMTPRLKALLHR